MTFKPGDQGRFEGDETVWTVSTNDGSGWLWLHRDETQTEPDGRTGSLNIMHLARVPVTDEDQQP